MSADNVGSCVAGLTASHPLSPFLAHQPSPYWKSQIAHSDIHYPVSGINSLIHSVSLASHSPPHSPVSSSLSSYPTYITIHHSFTLSFQAQNLPFQQILIFPTLTLLPWTAFTMGPDRTYHASRFIFSSFFSLIILFVPCGGLAYGRPKLMAHVTFLLHVTT